MGDHPQIEESNVPLVPCTSTSPHNRFPLVPPVTRLAFSTSSSPRSSHGGHGENYAALHTVIISLITTVGGYLLFQFQSKKLSLFDEHGNIMRAAFVILFLYVMAFMAEFRLQNQSNCFLAIMKQVTPLLGLLVVILLLFIMSRSLGLAASIIWALLVVGPTVRLFQAVMQWLRGIVEDICTSLAGTNHFDSTGNQENDPPV